MKCEKLLVGYDRQIITPEIGTWLGGYGNGKDRATIGKIFEDDDLFVTAITFTDAFGETAVIVTADLVRMPRKLFLMTREEIVKETGIKEQNIFISATHSHSSPEVVDAFIDAVENIRAWAQMFSEKCTLAVRRALKEQKSAEIFIGKKAVKNLNFVRRYMKDGAFLGTNAKGDAHESESDNTLQVIRFVRESAKDIVLANWGAHPDHSKTIGGEPGTPEYHRGCSADYIYSLRKTVTEKADVNFAFFQAAAGNLNARSNIPGEHEAVEARAEREGVMRYIAYGEELADNVLDILENSLVPVGSGRVCGAEDAVSADRAKGVKIGSAEYNRAYAVSVITYAKSELTTPTTESKSAALMLLKEYNLESFENVDKIIAEKQNPLYPYALCAKVLQSGGKLQKTDSHIIECAKKIAKFFGMKSGPYSSAGIIRKAHDALLEPIQLPIHAVSCGDIAFVGAPGEPFDTNGMQVKQASPFKMTFYCEHNGGAFGYYPSKLAWSHGGYETDATKCAEGTGEKIAECQIKLLNSLAEKI